ncbi:MAG TPA: hypothetical protein VFZ08_13930 [Terriglobia bacterium]|nr:hypothetical protein [Terriglobia bacterium]
MHAVVVGGHTRNIGKTSLAAGLIRAFPSLGWTAVKITQYGHGICSRDGKPCDCAPQTRPYLLTEEKDAAGHSDTSRFLAAGARRSLWLRARQGQLADALPTLEAALATDERVLIESNSILEFIQPDLYLVVLDSSRPDFKESARRYLARADALITFAPLALSRQWQELEAFLQKPTFRLPAGMDSIPALRDFVALKLDLT